MNFVSPSVEDVAGLRWLSLRSLFVIMSHAFSVVSCTFSQFGFTFHFTQLCSAFLFLFPSPPKLV